MGANNWTTCPECEKKAKAKQQQLLDEADKKYGKISRTEYNRLIAEAEKPFKLDETMREDWQLGVRGGMFRVSYRCHCQECGFEYSYRHEELPTNV